MFAKLRYRVEIIKCNAIIRKFNKIYYNKDVIDKIKKEKKDTSMDEHWAEYSAEVVPIEMEIQRIMSNSLIAEANKLMLPLPDHNDKEMWDNYYLGNITVLTKKGLSSVRAQIRRERKENTDQYLPWLALIVGLIGALTGLLSILKSK